MMYLETCPSCGMLALEHDRGLFEPYPYCHLCGWRETSPMGNYRMATTRDLETALAERPSGSEAAHIGESQTIQTINRQAPLKVVAISGYPRTPAGEIGRRISRSLSFDYYNRLLVERAARKLGATVDAVQSKAARPDTLGDRLTRLLERMMESSALGAAESELFFGYRYPGYPLLSGDEEPTVHYIRTAPGDISDADFAAAMAEVIGDVFERGNAVIVHPLACAALHGSAETLRIGIFMEDEDRVAALVDELGTTRREASRLLADEDRSLEVLSRKRFGVDAHSASTY
ncbi:MAG: cytidylate kinase family protein, partial [Chloroflexota bacterium]